MIDSPVILSDGKKLRKLNKDILNINKRDRIARIAARAAKRANMGRFI